MIRTHLSVFIACAVACLVAGCAQPSAPHFGGADAATTPPAPAPAAAPAVSHATADGPTAGAASDAGRVPVADPRSARG